MSVIRINKPTGNFSIIHNSGAQNALLSNKAKGLLWHLLTLPDDWQIYQNELTKHSTDGRDGIRKQLSELVAAGYIIKIDYHDARGRFQTEYTVFQEPQDEQKREEYVKAFDRGEIIRDGISDAVKPTRQNRRGKSNTTNNRSNKITKKQNTKKQNTQQSDSIPDEWKTLLLFVHSLNFSDCSLSSIRLFLKDGYDLNTVKSAFQHVRGYANFERLTAPTGEVVRILRTGDIPDAPPNPERPTLADALRDRLARAHAGGRWNDPDKLRLEHRENGTWAGLVANEDDLLFADAMLTAPVALAIHDATGEQVTIQFEVRE